MANEEMIQKHLDNFLAKIAGETPVDDTVQDSTEFWLDKIADQGGGSEVVANPTLAGTESDLTGLEVDGTKYKVPAGAYLASNTDANHISPDSYNYIVANWQTVPCFIWSGAQHRIFRVTTVTANEIKASSVIMIQNYQGRTTLGYISVRSSDYRIDLSTVYVDEIEANSTFSATEDLTKLKVKNVTYKVRDGATNGLGYLTTAPTSANNDGIKIVVLSSEPVTKYDGYLYLITEA